MKMLLLTALLLSGFSAHAYRETSPMIDVPTGDQIVQSVEFTGQPERRAQAAIINRHDGAELSLLITHQLSGDVRYYAVVNNAKLGLVTGGMAGTESTLAVAPNGALQVKQQNASVGRDRWERTLTISYRAGEYFVSGFTYSSRDTLVPSSGSSCDYDLLTGHGVRDGKDVMISRSALKLALLADTLPRLSSCEGW